MNLSAPWSSPPTPLLLWHGGGGGGGGVKNRDVIRFMEAETSRLKVLFSMRRLNLLSGSAGFASSVSGADAGLHLWTFAKRRLMPGGRRSSPGSSLTHTLEVISWGFDTDADELRSKESRLRRAQRGRLNRMSCCVFPLGLGVRWGGEGPGLPAWGVSTRLPGFVSLPRDQDRKKREVLGGREGAVGKPVDGAVCGSLSPPQPSASSTTPTSVQQWWDVTGGISPRGAEKSTETLNLCSRNVQTVSWETLS